MNKKTIIIEVIIKCVQICFCIFIWKSRTFNNLLADIFMIAEAQENLWILWIAFLVMAVMIVGIIMEGIPYVIKEIIECNDKNIG